MPMSVDDWPAEHGVAVDEHHTFAGREASNLVVQRGHHVAAQSEFGWHCRQEHLLNARVLRVANVGPQSLPNLAETDRAVVQIVRPFEENERVEVPGREQTGPAGIKGRTSHH